MNAEHIDIPIEPVMDVDAIERQARDRAIQIEKDAFDKGFQAGQEQGSVLFEENASKLINQLDTMITELAGLKEKLTAEAEPEIVKLAITIAKKAFYEELSINPEIIVRLVKEAISRVEKMGQITIKIHPSLHEMFLQKKPEFHELHQEIVLDIDPTLPINGPLVVGPMEEVVTNVDELLINVLEDMRQKLAVH
ncbi:MAG: hypothetical protein L7F77_00960 [Candidatus Magnetominusculus sp. LBB02]|nr:hypothetical protein [Candidatus Magnetominusculus sp. LBB02]